MRPTGGPNSDAAPVPSISRTVAIEVVIFRGESGAYSRWKALHSQIFWVLDLLTRALPSWVIKFRGCWMRSRVAVQTASELSNFIGGRPMRPVGITRVVGRSPRALDFSHCCDRSIMHCASARISFSHPLDGLLDSPSCRNPAMVEHPRARLHDLKLQYTTDIFQENHQGGVSTSSKFQMGGNCKNC